MKIKIKKLKGINQKKIKKKRKIHQLKEINHQIKIPIKKKELPKKLLMENKN